ncbi:MAG: hypothetical protein ACE5FY_04055 [Nitrospiria bacterium]
MSKTRQNSKYRPLRLLIIPIFLFFLTFNAAHAETPLESKKTGASIIIDEFEIGLTGVVSPGKHTLHVKNAGTMLHEVVIFKLKNGITASNFKSVISAGGSLRKVGKMKGNMPPILSGATGNVTATFEPGNYLLLCFQVDLKTGQPHFMIGMLHEFTVT